MEGIGKAARIAAISGLGVTALRLVRRRAVDPAHAPGKRHRAPALAPRGPESVGAEPDLDQPWVRRSHSDSQQRRFRR